MGKSGLKIPIVELDWTKLKLPAYEKKSFNNGAQLYQIQSNKPGLSSFEIVFRNGRCTEHKKLSSRMAANQLQEGTAILSSEQVADTVDYYGANLTIHSDLDFTVISMSCLQKHFEFLVGFITNLILNPAYRESDLAKAKLFLKSQLHHQLTEPDYVSYREFTSLIYGSSSIYGYNTNQHLIDDLQREDLLKYQQENYVADFMYVFYCGDIKPTIEGFLEQIILQFRNLNANKSIVFPNIYCPAEQKHFSIENCAQISLKMGLRWHQKIHPDFYGMYVLNTILGDYFGSRLMKNIREDKGYTYDIHAALDAQVYDGCFYISAELNPEQAEDAILLIKGEIKRIQTELIPDEELNLVKNYLCGNIMRMMDGPFQTMVFLKVLVTEYGSPESFHKLLEEILNVQPNNLKNLAEKYLRIEEMSQVTAGA
ncbi:MAG: pitrilysin family protein [Saprospiraceae bacterium]